MSTVWQDFAGDSGAQARERRFFLDWLELTKPRIASFIVFAAFVGGLLAAGSVDAWPRALEAALLVGAVGAASSVFNQVIEIHTDALMRRTRERPLPSGRISPQAALGFAAVVATTAVAALAVRFGLACALLSLGTLVAYALVYTPLKRHSTLNTLVGALPGAMPPLLGFVALAPVGERFGGWGLALFAIVFAWQFPHFMAIAWLHRVDYARAGMKMIPALESSEGEAGQQALLYSLALLSVSFVPVLSGDAGVVYGIAALVLGLMYVAASAAFARRENRRTARALLLVSLIHLPVLLGFTLIDPVVQLFGS